MATFTWRPSFGPQATKRPKVNAAPFGDGYTQRAAKGINNNPPSWSLSFDSLDDATADAIENFLDDHKGVTSFTWVDPRNVSGLYICSSYDRSYDDEEKNSIRAVFDRVYGG